MYCCGGLWFVLYKKKCKNICEDVNDIEKFWFFFLFLIDLCLFLFKNC